MPKFERQVAARPAELAGMIDSRLRKLGMSLTDSSTYGVGSAVAILQVWGCLTVLVIGSQQLTTVTAISSSPEDASLLERILEEIHGS